MAQINVQSPSIRELEALLAREEKLPSRFELLDRLCSHYAFIDLEKARQLLVQTEELLEKDPLPDYLINYHLNAAFVENQLYNFPSAVEHYMRALDLLEERGDIKQQVDAFVDLAGVWMNILNTEEASRFLVRAKRLLKVFPDDRLSARLLCREGYLSLQFYNNSADATASFLKAEKLLIARPDELDLKDYYFLTLIYSGLGSVYEKNDSLEKSIKAYLNAVRICESLDIRSRLSWHYLHVGSAYLGLSDDENAEFYFQKAISNPDDSSRQSRARALGNLGFLSLRKKRFDEALELFDQAEELFKEESADDFSNFATMDRWRARIYAETGSTQKALDHFNQAYQHARQVDDYAQLCGICKDIATIYAEMEDYKNAYQHQLLYEEFSEKYLEKVKERKTEELEVKYEAEKKKQEAELLRLQAIRLQLKALRAQMNPHFMHNALNSIQDYITSGDTTNASIFLAKFASLMRQSLDYSDLETISLEQEIDFLKNYLELNKNLRFAGRMDFEITVDEDIEEDIFGVPTMIVQPYVENAIEHGIRGSKNGFVKVSFQPIDDDNILCVVEDNGIGREEARRRREANPAFQNHRSKGTSITEERLHILHSSDKKKLFVNTIDLVDKETGKPCGTRVEIQIPVAEITVK